MRFGAPPAPQPAAQPDNWQNAALLAQTVASIGTDVYRASQGLPREMAPPLPPPPTESGTSPMLIIGVLVLLGVIGFVAFGGKKAKGKGASS